jgi:translocation and assembly module TamA
MHTHPPVAPASPGRWGRWLAAIGMLALGGCALMPSTPQAPPEPGLQQAYHLDIEAPEATRDLLRQFLDASKFQRVPKGDGVTPQELNRLVGGAAAQARSLLETQGRFAPTIQIQGAPERDGLPTFVLRVDPGPEARVRQVQLRFTGALDTQARQKEAAALALQDNLSQGWRLKEGRAFQASTWTEAKGELELRARARGYPLARLSQSEASVDAQTHQVDIALELDSGPLALLGEVLVEGQVHVQAQAVRALAGFKPGTPYAEQTLQEYTDRLRGTELFDGVSVRLGAEADAQGHWPVLVKVRENVLRQATVALGYNDNSRESVSVEFIHRDVLGLHWANKSRLDLARRKQELETQFRSHPLSNGEALFTDGKLKRDLTKGPEQVDQELNLGVSAENRRIERRIYGQWARTTLQDSEWPDRKTRKSAVSGNYEWLWRDVDNLLVPTEGFAARLRTTAGYALEQKGPFGRAYARLTYYQSWGAWRTQARAEAGTVLAKAGLGVPEQLLFKAGGTESVRGYSEKSLGATPALALSGGRQLFTASLEAAHPVSERFPSVLGAAFVDAGNTANHWRDLKPALGYGVGVRWISPFGTLRVDVAYGRQTRQFKPHINLALVF